MKVFAAGADPAELRRCVEDGLCEGVVLLGDATGLSPEGVAALGRAGTGPILVEVASAGDAAALGPRFAARIPFAAGAATFAACKAAGVASNAVGCATADEGLAAARAGATWVSPALSGQSPGTASGADHDLIRKTRALLRTFGQRAELLVGPLGDEGVLFDVTVMGAHAVLAGPELLRRMAARRAGAAGAA
jgi:hypothetical protein